VKQGAAPSPARWRYEPALRAPSPPPTGGIASAPRPARPDLESGQVATETEVQAVAKGEMTRHLSVDVEAVRIRKCSLVAICRAVEDHHDAASFDGLAMVFDLTGDIARLDR